MSSILILSGIMAAIFGFGRLALAWVGRGRLERKLPMRAPFATSFAALGVALIVAGGALVDGGHDLSDRLGSQHPLYATVVAAEHGDAAEQFLLGNGYYYGELNLSQDFAEAAKWLRMAARQGHPDAMVKLANLYEHGRGVERSRLIAEVWYRKAAVEGVAG